MVEKGIYKAFVKFINKTLLQEDIEKLKNIKNEEVKDLIFSYQIASNKINKEKKNFYFLICRKNISTVFFFAKCYLHWKLEPFFGDVTFFGDVIFGPKMAPKLA